MIRKRFWAFGVLIAAASHTLLLSGCHSGSAENDGPPPNAPQAVNVSRDPWTLVTTNPYGHHGGYLGNGFLGMRFGPSGTTDSPDGKAPYNAPANKGRDLLCVVSGAYSNEHLIAAPNWGSFQFLSGDVKVYPEYGHVTDYKQTLDMRRGELLTSYTVDRGRPAFSVELTTRVQRDRPGIVTITARVTPREDGVLRLSAPPPAPDPELYEPVPNLSIPVRQVLKVKGGSAPSTAYLAIVSGLETWDAQGNPVPQSLNEKRGVRGFVVKARQPITLSKIISVAAFPSQPTQNAIDVKTAFHTVTPDQLAASHRAAWEKLWRSDIQIDGDLEAQHAVRSSLFYLLCSVREGGKWSIPPMGLSGIQWGGHIFWDADTWMYPVLGLLHPELARSLVDYRYDTLAGAKENAKKSGYKGADYATESAVSGREIAPAEFPLHDQTSADVAMAQWHQFLLSGDRRRLAERAYPILRETSAYYVSRAVYNKAKDRYEIRQVVSPDETAGIVDNDVYTNAAAKRSLEYAVEASKLLGKPYPPQWKVIADKLWLPFDAANNRYLEHEGYVKTRHKPKQADAQLLFFPLDLDASWEVKANTLTFYAGHTSPIGPAMTSSVHAVIAARLAADPAKASVSGEWSAKAVDYFRQSYRPFLRPPFNDFSEKRTMNNSTFLTGCAGVALGPLYGFGGIRYDNDGIEARPILPSGWKRLKITGVHYRGRVYSLEVLPGKPGRLVPQRAEE